MATRDEEGKRKREEDRVSSLPDEILIEILSRLPLQLAMATSCFSSRWRALWTHITTVHLTSTEIDKAMTRSFKPPDFSFVLHSTTNPRPHQVVIQWRTVNLDYAWLRCICDRNNLRELKAINTPMYYRQVLVRDLLNHTGPIVYQLPKFYFPDFICQTQSLVSIELDSTWSLQLPDEGVPINLPNLKKLHLCQCYFSVEPLERLIKACPALEELSFKYILWHNPGPGRHVMESIIHMNISHQNLRRLFVKGLLDKYRVVVNAPKLEYLAIHVSTSVTLCFEKEPMVSRGTQIDICSYGGLITEDDIKLMSKFLGVFSNVVIHTPDVFVGDKDNPCWPSGMFCNATRLTLSLDRYWCHDINTLLAILKLCPVLDILTLRTWDSEGYMIGPVSTLRRALKKIIKLETKWDINVKPEESFLEYLLYKFIDLEELFHVKVNWSNSDEGSTEYAQNREMELCRRLYERPIMVSAGCEIEFVGRFFKVTRKGCHKFWIANNGKDVSAI